MNGEVSADGSTSVGFDDFDAMNGGADIDTGAIDFSFPDSAVSDIKSAGADLDAINEMNAADFSFELF